MTSKRRLAPLPAAETLTVETKVYGERMEMHFRVIKGLGLTEARSAEEFYGFHHNHVATFHSHKQGYGCGLFFRLHDGRVFDVQGRPHDPDLSWYDQPTH
jgi:hypothetical protein